MTTNTIKETIIRVLQNDERLWNEANDWLTCRGGFDLGAILLQT